MKKRYMALGDSISIDLYTDVIGGGAVSQLYKRLCSKQLNNWMLDDRTYDGCVMSGVRPDLNGHWPADLITMTIGGNDLLQHMDRDPAEFIPVFAREYAHLTSSIRRIHPQATVIVGNIYRPSWEDLPKHLEVALGECNRVIGQWVRQRGFHLADIHGAFLGHEAEYLCHDIEPTLAGATAIADLFEAAFYGE
ncbi:MAG: SGNH/GDSL hydrolase family protein [Planctomycetota bacterium]